MVINALHVLDRILGWIAIIPFPTHLTIVPSATFCSTGKHWAMSHCMKESMVLIAWVRFGVKDTKLFFGPFGIATHLNTPKLLVKLICELKGGNNERRRNGDMLFNL
jgi:hypothetical protein